MQVTSQLMCARVGATLIVPVILHLSKGQECPSIDLTKTIKCLWFDCFSLQLQLKLNVSTIRKKKKLNVPTNCCYNRLANHSSIYNCNISSDGCGLFDNNISWLNDPPSFHVLSSNHLRLLIKIIILVFSKIKIHTSVLFSYLLHVYQHHVYPI
jgi:hypothetical protein